jgi:hypothetical protein
MNSTSAIRYQNEVNGPRTQVIPALFYYNATDYQSSSSFFREFIAAWRCRKASAKLPATLPPLSRALSVLLAPEPEYPLSLVAGAGTGFFPAGRFVGGAGGVGLPRVPLPLTPLTAVGAGRAATGGGGGGGGAATSSMYAEGTQPEAELSGRRASHQPDEIT